MKSLSQTHVATNLKNAGDSITMGSEISTPKQSLPTWSIGLLYLVFFLSGAAALIYEISWSRQIGLLFGHTIYAAAVVLASYFSGMAIGHLVGARWSNRIPPLVGYGIAELVAACWACMIPIILRFSETPAMAVWLSDSSFAWQSTVRVLFSFFLLIPATTALGATLPMMAELLAYQKNRSLADSPNSARVSLAYAINTFGALTGVVVATFFLLSIVGVQASSFLAAGLSSICGLIAFGIAKTPAFKWTKPTQTESIVSTTTLHHSDAAILGADETGTYDSKVDAFESRSKAWIAKYSVALAALSGFGTLALEVLYVRMFSLVFHNSTYTFGAVLTVFLLSLAVGAAIVSRLQRRFRAETLIATACMVGSIAVPISIVVFTAVTNLDYFTWGTSFSSYLFGAFMLVIFVVLAPVTCLGAVLPLVWKSAGGHHRSAGSTVGRLTAANTIAAAMGSICASFLFLPFVDLWPSFALVALPFWIVGALLFFMQGRQVTLIACTLAFLALAYVSLQSPTQSEWGRQREEIVRRWLSPYGWIDVVRSRTSGALKISQNLHYRFGSTGRSAEREFRQAHIPLLLHKNPRQTLFLGLGTGMTAGGAVPHRSLEDIFVVELIPHVVDAARLLADGNRNIVDHPKTTVRVDDARHFLLAESRQFDVIVSDLFVPWESQTGYLYTVEHYRIARQRLAQDGLFCQWLPLYQMGTAEFELIADSFATVFPNTTLWWGQLDGRKPIMALIGSDVPIQINPTTVAPRIKEIQQSSPTDMQLRSANAIYELYVGDWKAQNDRNLNTDEHPRVEFQTPVTHRDRDLLRDDLFQEYFDTVLSACASDGVEFDSDSASDAKNPTKRRDRQRFLFSR